MDISAVLLQAQTFGSLQRRAHAAEQALADMVRTTIPKDEAFATAVLLAMAAFGAGMTVEAYLLSEPGLNEKLGEGARLYATSVLECLAEQGQGVPRLPDPA